MKKTYSIKTVRKFVKNAFKENPHHSFNDWRIMYNHSLTVESLVLKLAKHFDCNKTALSIGALLHDIGKTYQADPITLHEKHEELNLVVARDFLNKLGLDQATYKIIEEILTQKGNSNEMKIVKDADTMSLWKNKKFYMLLIQWLIKNDLQDSIKRKLGKFDNLNFEISKKISKKWYSRMKRDWQQYTNK